MLRPFSRWMLSGSAEPSPAEDVVIGARCLLQSSASLIHGNDTHSRHTSWSLRNRRADWRRRHGHLSCAVKQFFQLTIMTRAAAKLADIFPRYRVCDPSNIGTEFGSICKPERVR